MLGLSYHLRIIAQLLNFCRQLCNVSGKSDDVFPIQEQAEHTQYNPHTREKDHANAQVGRNLTRKKAAMRTPERETARTPSHAQVSHSV